MVIELNYHADRTNSTRRRLMFICRFHARLRDYGVRKRKSKTKTSRRHNSKQRPESNRKHDGQPTSSGRHVSGCTDIRLQATLMYVFRGQGHQTTRMRLARSRRRCLAWLVHRARSVVPLKSYIPHMPRSPLYRIIILFPLPIWGNGGKICGDAMWSCSLSPSKYPWLSPDRT